jgi:hypothetical protein
MKIIKLITVFLITLLLLTKITLDIYTISNHTPKTEEIIKSKYSIILTLFYITILAVLFLTVGFNINSFTGIFEICLLINIFLLILLINHFGTHFLMQINNFLVTYYQL